MSVPMAIALSGQPLLGQFVMVKPSEAEKNLVPSNASGGTSVIGPYGETDRKLYVGNLHFNMTEFQLKQELKLDVESGAYILDNIHKDVDIGYPIDLEQHDRREQLKKSNLGKVIMFLSKSDEETTSNRKLAKDLVDKWSRPIFNKSTRFEDMRNYEDERAPYRRPTVRRPVNKDVGMDSRDDDLDLGESSKRAKSSQSSDRLHASRPEALAMDFVVRPQSKIDPEEIRARAKQIVLDQRRLKMNKKLQQLKAPKKKQLQATKLSIEGRGMVKYL